MTEKYPQAPKQRYPSLHIPQSLSSDPSLMASVVLASRMQLWSNSCLAEHLCWRIEVPFGKVCLVVGGCRGTLSCYRAGNWTQKDAFGSILYGKRWDASERELLSTFSAARMYLLFWDLFIGDVRSIHFQLTRAGNTQFSSRYIEDFLIYGLITSLSYAIFQIVNIQ